ncbi:adenine deaminase [Peribacillus acanthi]|uniref:adenine deaminase n=1 Tax=Peribacillus acanthi TaxID=2171554 RepID=UPI000D3E64F8|nr:adenine deaminase [Peribacillus acanthi]
MAIDKNQFIKRIHVASKKIPADIVIKNGRIIDVFNLDILDGDIAIADGMIVGIGNFEGLHIIDAKNRYISPGFIDGHVHIESSMVTPTEFAKVVLPHGVTTVITDPHEIANVSGSNGIQFMIENSEGIPLDIYFMLPSSVPATPYENSGAILEAHDLETFFKYKRVIGLAEVMDYPSLQNAEDSIVDKLLMTYSNSQLIDGHLAGLNANAVNIYRAAGIRTDHECYMVEDALDRLRRGMYLLIREGSVAKDLQSLIKVVNFQNARRCLFCTDDKHIDDLVVEGSIDHNVRLAINNGIDPFLAIQMASLNAAECYGLNQKGAIAPGYEADLLFLDDLKDVQISEVYKSGKLVAAKGKYVGESIVKQEPTAELTNTIHFPGISELNLQIPIGESSRANVIGITPNQLTTKKLNESVTTEYGCFKPSIEHDQLKLVVVERHKNTGNIGLGIVKGFGMKDGAIATTIAHDSHNLVCTGTNDGDIISAVNALKKMNGGLVVVKQGEVIASLPLTIAGLISNQDYSIVHTELKNIKNALTKLDFHGNSNPFLTLSFLTLPVIPSLKLTDLGLFDFENFRHIEVGL